VDSVIKQVAASATLHAVDYAGRKVVYRQFGKGSPLLLLHGGHGSWLHWIRNIEALSRHHSVFVPDMPGFGDSETLAAEDSMAAIAQAVAGSIDSLVGADTPIGLVGFSFGGLVAANVAASRKGVARLALIGSGGHGGERRQQLALVQWRDAPDELALARAMRHNLSALMLSDPARIDALAMQVHTLSCQRTRFRSRDLSRGGSLARTLAAYTQPVLFIWGEHDVTADPAVAIAALTAAGPSRQGLVVPDAGHWAQYEQPERINAALIDWFADGVPLSPSKEETA
jgi:pimeloyl-ACP methyl ester carboxylesterase